MINLIINYENCIHKCIPKIMKIINCAAWVLDNFCWRKTYDWSPHVSVYDLMCPPVGHMPIQINLRRSGPPVVAEIRKPGKTINFYKCTNDAAPWGVSW